MENHIQSTTNFRDFIPSCVHGRKLDEKCEECEVIKKTNEERRKKTQEDYEAETKEWEEKENESRQKNPHLYMKFIPLKFRSRSFENFNGSEEVKKILKKYCDSFMVSNTNPGSVLMTGKTGCGKTHLAVAIVTELVKRSRRLYCRFITAPELLLEIRATYGTNNETSEEAIIKEYSDCDLLILDDLGAEKTSEFSIQSLYLIIDRRNRELKPTIITTNLSLEEIEKKIDARMASRLADMKIIKLNMPDYRKKRG